MTGRVSALPRPRSSGFTGRSSRFNGGTAPCGSLALAWVPTRSRVGSVAVTRQVVASQKLVTAVLRNNAAALIVATCIQVGSFGA